MADHAHRICFIYGFCEGPRLAGKMLAVLREAGHTITDDPYAADVVIAHSGGCLLVPQDLPKQTRVIMIGLTHWPGKSILWSLIQKNWNDLLHHRHERAGNVWLQKFSWNMIYFWNMRHNLRMLRELQRGDFWHTPHLTLVRNAEDSFCTPYLASLPFSHQPQYVGLPGQHDDLWLHPERYLTVIQ
ncbi:MAG TPA: hypothetical protein VLF91_03785 [Candidatus Saccharimonadales bacterium]|nr:hypothetical protein [Candidatus Saccharimonadales bacterium]